MEDSETSEMEDGQPRHRPKKPRSRRRRFLIYAATGLSVILVIGMIAGVAVYRSLISNVERVDAFEDIIDARPAAPTESRDALDILIIGDDSRKGASGKYLGGYTPGLSDTTILFHVSADRSRAYAVNVPRDLMVDRPACKSKNDPDRTVPAAGSEPWNVAYAVGGPACTIAQFEKMTDIRVDHFAVLRFQSIVDIVDALGGVEICVPETVVGFGEVMLEKGTYVADGETARLYVQIRRQMGDGSDVGRMKRHQRFLSSLTAKLTSTGTLANPGRLYNFLDESTKAVTTDPDLVQFSKLFNLAWELRKIGMDHVQFLTMPIAPFAPNPNRLAAGEGAEQMWSELRNDDPLSSEFTGEAVSGTDRAVAPGRAGRSVALLGGDYALC